jgi:hypothetical protein
VLSRIQPFALACIFVTAGLIPALDYGFGPGAETMTARRDVHRAIMNGTARTPDRYRWLSATIVEGPTRILAAVMPWDRAYDRVSFVFYLAAITGMLWSLFAYLRKWFPEEAALVASLMAACTIRITMRQHDYAPYSYLEPTLVALALLAILNRRHGWFGALVAVAAFNRETAIFLVLLYLVTSERTPADWMRTAGYAAIWGCCYGLVRVVGGDADRYWTTDLVWRTNLSQPQLAAFNIMLLLGAFWWFAALGWRYAPAFVRRTALIVPPYLVTVAVWGIWWEVRLLMPLYPVLFALALAYLCAPPPEPALSEPRRVEGPAWILAAVFVTAVAVNAFDYSVLVPQPQLRYDMHQAIVAGTAPSPQRYRVLVPWLLDPVINAWSSLTAPQQAFRRVYFAFHVLALTAILAGVYAYCRLWFSRERALIAALIVGSVLRLALRMGEYWDSSPIPDHSWFAPWSLVEPVFVAAGLILVFKRRWTALGVVLVLAALNSGAAAWFAGGLGAPLASLDANLAHLPATTLNALLFLGPALILAATGCSRAPRFARNAMIASTPLLLGVALFGYWWDVRLLTPLYPVVAPLFLSGVFRES